MCGGVGGRGGGGGERGGGGMGMRGGGAGGRGLGGPFDQCRTDRRQAGCACSGGPEWGAGSPVELGQRAARRNPPGDDLGATEGLGRPGRQEATASRKGREVSAIAPTQALLRVVATGGGRVRRRQRRRSPGPQGRATRQLPG